MIMKRGIKSGTSPAAVLLLVFGLAVSISSAGEPFEARQGDDHPPAFGFPALYENDGNPMLQKFELTGIVQWQYAWVDAVQGRANEHEFRRFRFGADARFLDHFSISNSVNFDPEWDPFYDSLSQAFLSYSPFGNDDEDFESLRVSAGKIKPLFTREYSTSAKKIRTFERSLLVNQLAPDKTTGVLIGGLLDQLEYSLSALAGEASDEFSRFNEGTLILVKIDREMAKEFNLGIDFLMVFGEQQVTSDIDYAVSISASFNPDYKLGDWAVMGDLLHSSGKHGQPDTSGAVILASYQLSTLWEFVGRYQYAVSDGPDGLQLQRRYEQDVRGVTGKGLGDSYQAAYLGANFKVHGDQLKFMVGAEYSHMDGGGDGGDFSGWTLFVGARSYF
jgi:phosphate-selective porin OprO/OprP